MPREVPEWIGKTADTPIPDRVKERIARECDDRCQKCRRPVGPKLPARFDHVTPLILGGANRETNIQLLCEPCHTAKTGLDVRLKAKVARVRKRQLGIRRPRSIRAWRKFNGDPVYAPQDRNGG